MTISQRNGWHLLLELRGISPSLTILQSTYLILAQLGGIICLYTLLGLNESQIGLDLAIEGRLILNGASLVRSIRALAWNDRVEVHH